MHAGQGIGPCLPLSEPPGMTITVHGVHVQIAAASDDLMSQLRNRFPPGWRPAVRGPFLKNYRLGPAGHAPLAGRDAAQPAFCLFEDDVAIAECNEVEPLLDVFESELE